MEETHEKEKTRRWPKIAIGGIGMNLLSLGLRKHCLESWHHAVIISAIALVGYKGYKRHQSLPPAIQQQIRTRIAENIVREVEQSRRKLGKGNPNDQAYYQVFLERANNGYGPLDMLWNVREIAHQISERKEEIAERQREQVRKERGKVTNREVHQKACEKLDKWRSVRKRKQLLERPWGIYLRIRESRRGEGRRQTGGNLRGTVLQAPQRQKDPWIIYLLQFYIFHHFSVTISW